MAGIRYVMKRTKRRVITTLQNTIHIRSYSLINAINFQNARFSKAAAAFNEKVSKSYNLFQKIKLINKRTMNSYKNGAVR